MKLKYKHIVKGGRLKDSTVKNPDSIKTQFVNGSSIPLKSDSKSKISVPEILLQKKEDVIIPNSITITENTTPAHISRKVSTTVDFNKNGLRHSGTTPLRKNSSEMGSIEKNMCIVVNYKTPKSTLKSRNREIGPPLQSVHTLLPK